MSKKRDWLIQIRKEAGFKQNELAEKIGIGKSYLSEIEKGNRTPSGKLGLKIARALEFNMERFYEDDKELIS
ncbi:helix-turn-helix transcriptional regulator [Halobacillus sp. H74]|uniref:helix-turn-helix transcriptional regulator n=1 Tax=Halobacillus sp. H74 TaxID=3457436 RepID=UPI003FCEDDB0